MDDRQCQLGIIGRRVLDEAGQGRIVQRLHHTLAVELGDPVRRVLGGRRRFDCGGALHFAQRQAFAVLACEEFLVRAGGGGDPFERRVRDEVADLIVDHQPGLPAHLGVLHRIAITLREVPGERLGCLVHVLIGVEDRHIAPLRFGHDTFFGCGAYAGLPSPPNTYWPIMLRKTSSVPP